MTKHKIAETYQDVLGFFLERTHFYSGHYWSTESEHDPGLTTMQLLANAVALLEEEYHALQGETAMFEHLPYSPWQQAVQDEAGTLHFKPHLTAPIAQDFKSSPAVSEDIRCIIEAIPGISRAWVHKKKIEDTTLLVAFAAVMPSLKGNVTTKEEIPSEQKEQILRSVSWRLQKAQGLCQPVLPAREAVPFPLCLSVTLECEPCEFDGAQTQKADVPAKIANVMAAVEEFLHSGSYPKTCFQAADLLPHLKGVTALRCGSVIEGINNFFQGHEQITLSDTQDFFKIICWQFSLEHAHHVRDATPDELRMAKYLCTAQSVRDVWTKQWFKPTEQQDNTALEGKDTAYTSDFTRANQIMIHQQFPSCYNIDNTTAKPPVEALQMQGWLLLFEQLLADMVNPLDSSDRYFQFHPLQPIDFVGNIAHPLLSKLSATEEYHETFAAMTANEQHFSQLPRNLLLHLAALQGERMWRHAEDIDTQGKNSLDADDIAFCLRRLAYCNGHRLSDSRQQGIGRLELGGAILEERLSMLIRPLTDLAPKLPQRYFDMRFTPNPLTGDDEFRCYIRDDEGNIRIICDLMSSNPLEAERVALMVLRLAGLSDHYSLSDKTIRIGWLAKLPNQYSELEASACIKACEEWAKTLLPPWVKVLSYEELGQRLPYCLAVLIEAEDIPQSHRDSLTDEIRQNIPAHLYPRIFFLTREDRRRVDWLLRGPDGSGFNLECSRFIALRNILDQYEQTQNLASSNE